VDVNALGGREAAGRRRSGAEKANVSVAAVGGIGTSGRAMGRMGNV
jgi:hypothetical protein